MVSNIYIMNLVRPKNEISQIVATIFSPEQKYIHTFYAVISMKAFDIVFEQMIDNIKEVNKTIQRRNSMTVVLQKRKHTMIACCHL